MLSNISGLGTQADNYEQTLISLHGYSSQFNAHNIMPLNFRHHVETVLGPCT